MRLLLIVLLVAISTSSFAQKRPKLCREGCAPYVNFFMIKGDSLLPISTLQKNKPNKIRIALDGGIEKVQHKMIITSKNAKVVKVEGTENDFIITPQASICEVIVDVKTYEDYQEVQKVKKNGQETKEVIKTFPPKTYMVGYERFASR